MRIKKKKAILFIGLVVLLIASLIVYYGKKYDIAFFHKGLKEGEINYTIKYYENGKDDLFISLLPSSMKIKFKNKSSFGEMKAFWGIFKSNYISNYKTKTNSCLFNAMGQKLNLETKFEEPSLGFDELPGISIMKTKDKKLIAGYNCKKAIATYGSTKKDSIIIYYTEDILIYKPNWNNPFKEIDGVLMEFEAMMMGIRMKCTATKVDKVKVPDSDFEVPAGYTKVTKAEMENFINKLKVNNK